MTLRVAIYDEQLALGMISSEDLAYIEGFFDGEGSVSIRIHHRDNGRLCVGFSLTISNSNKNILDWVASYLGGKVYTNTTASKTLVMYNWQLRNHKSLKIVLTALLPYLRVKRNQALLLLKAISLLKPRPGTCKGINRKGASLRHPDEYFNQFCQLHQELLELRESEKNRLLCKE